MSRIRVENPSRGTVLGDRVEVASTWWRRLRGLLGRRSLADGEGMLLVPCRGVHTYWMRFPLDVVLMDPAHEVIATYEDLAPGGRTGIHRDARYTLELPSGAIDRSETREGDVLAWEVC